MGNKPSLAGAAQASPTTAEVQALREQVSRLQEQLQREKAKSELLDQELQSLAYSVSHDLRAPLRHLIGFSGALLEDCQDQLEGPAKVYLDCIGRAGQKMEGLIDALLRLSRLVRQEITVHCVDLSTVARQYAQALQDAAPQRRVSFSIADNLSACGDPALLRSALQNLLENAWKYTEKNDGAEISVGKRDLGGESAFFVRDNGVGFDMKYASRLFGPFQRLHQEGEYQGAGVGLAMVQRIVRRHGGRVWAEAAVNEGATFYFTLADCPG